MFPVLTPDSLDSLLLGSVRLMLLFGFFLYLIFPFIALRQIEIMRKTVFTPFSGMVFLIGLLHVLIAVLALAFAFVTLM